jgi:hypothetical protein
LFQFIDGTAKKYGLTDPYDPVASTRAAIRLAKDNIKATGARDGAEMYMAHQWGAGGFNKMRNADPNASVASVLGAKAAKNNAMGGMTVAQGLEYWRNKFNKGATQAAPTPPTTLLANNTSQVPVVQDGGNVLIPTTQPEADLFGRVHKAGLPPEQEAQYAKASSMIAGAQQLLKGSDDIFGDFASAPGPLDNELLDLIDTV